MAALLKETGQALWSALQFPLEQTGVASKPWLPLCLYCFLSQFLRDAENFLQVLSEPEAATTKGTYVPVKRPCLPVLSVAVSPGGHQPGQVEAEGLEAGTH